MEKLKAILDKSGLEKTIKWGTDVYVYNGKNIVGCVAFKNHITLWFYNGVFLKDKYKVLINASKDKTKYLRQWRFTDINEINEPKILEYIKEATELIDKGIEGKPNKFKPVPIPSLLKDEFAKNKNLHKAFLNLTPGKQKEYNLYIEEAKQEKTKLSRIEKITPLILAGIGLNDKYKK
ncbi:MAG: YdeI/OmpD-associated family protein [Chitinophagales bacterium]